MRGRFARYSSHKTARPRHCRFDLHLGCVGDFFSRYTMEVDFIIFSFNRIFIGADMEFVARLSTTTNHGVLESAKRSYRRGLSYISIKSRYRFGWIMG